MNMEATIDYYEESACDICDGRNVLCVHITNICGDVAVYCIKCLEKMVKEIEEIQYNDWLSVNG